MESENRIYVLLKFSYKGEGETDCILPGLHCGTCITLDMLLTLIKKHLTLTNVKTAWVPSNEDDEHLFYVTYKEEFEQGLHHGFKVQVMYTKTGKIKFLTKAVDEEATKAVRLLVQEWNKEQ